MLDASGMQLIFLPKSQKINRHVWMLLNMTVYVRGGDGRDGSVPQSWKQPNLGKKGAKPSVKS